MDSRDKFISEIKKLIIDFEDKAKHYDELKHQDDDQRCEDIWRGKTATFKFVVDRLKQNLKWYGLD